MKKGNILLVVILGVVVIFSFGLYLFAKNFFAQTTFRHPPAPNQPATVAAAPRPAWQVYRHDNYNYSFSYPASWKVSGWDIQEAAKLSRPGMGNIWQQVLLDGQNGEHFEVLIWSNSTFYPVRQWLDWYRHEDLPLHDIPRDSNFEIAGHAAWLFPHSNFAKGYPVIHIIFGHEDKVFELIYKIEKGETATASAKNSHQQVYDKIIKSFRIMI